MPITEHTKTIFAGLIALLSVALAGACDSGSPPPARRAEVRQVAPAAIEILPAAGQLPYCLVFTESDKGVLRQLTMSFEDQSIPCEAGKAVGEKKYNIPAAEGKVRIYVIFSDRPLKGSTVAAQLNEAWSDKRTLTAFDLRAPGQAAIEAIEFTPST